MKKTTVSVVLLVSVFGLPILLAGCDDGQTHADPRIEKSMQDQRSAQGGNKGPTPRPGHTTPGK